MLTNHQYVLSIVLSRWWGCPRLGEWTRQWSPPRLMLWWLSWGGTQYWTGWVQLPIGPFSLPLQACSWTSRWVDLSSPKWGSPESMVSVCVRLLLTRMQSSQSWSTWPQHLGKLDWRNKLGAVFCLLLESRLRLRPWLILLDINISFPLLRMNSKVIDHKLNDPLW